MNVAEDSVISLMTIGPALESSRLLKIKGISWNSSGKRTAEYWSSGVALDVGNRKLFYYWEGQHPYEKTTPHFFGVGEIEFVDFGYGSVSTAKGWYSETPRADLDRTVRKSTQYARAGDEDVRAILSGDHAAITKVIKTRIEELKKIVQ